MKNEKGVSLIEVLVALALLGIIAVAFLVGLATASKALFIADERATAESLARSQMEYVKNQEYIDYSVEGHEDYELITSPDGYEIELEVESLPDPNDGILDDIQKITLLVRHHGKEIFIFIRDGEKITLEDYKVDR